MASYLFATVGGQDVQFNKDSLDNIDKGLCGTDRSGTKKGTFSSPRETGQKISSNFCKFKDKLDYPIIDPVIDYLNEQKFTPDKIFLFVSNQKPPAPSDTIFLGEILQKHFTDGGLACEVIALNEDPSSFDDQYNSINKKLSEIEKRLNPSEDSVFVFPQAGTPATRNALLLNCILYFPKLIQLGKPRGGGVAQQHFPQKFREQVRIKALPSKLKETLATISARNLSHTDGSHVMLSFQKNLKEKLDALQSMASSTGFKNLKEKYDAFSDYLRGQMEYVADLSGQTASQTFFDYNFSSEVENLKEIIQFFLGNGLIDDLEHKNDTNVEPVKVNLIFKTEKTSREKIVSIPGGSNGINAFYTIVKNFIRNLYKHSSYTINKPFNTPSYNISILLKKSQWQDYYEVTLYDSQTYDETEINEIMNGIGHKKGINGCIDDKLLDDNGGVRDYGWGILEMKIAACYLTGLPLIYFDEPANSKGEVDLSKKEVKKVFPKPLDVMNHENHLAYRFYLLKPETFLVIGNDIPTDKTNYQDVGITFSKGDEPETDLNTRAKLIIDTLDHDSGVLKTNNIRQINFFNGKISKLLTEKGRKEIISEWQQKMFLSDGQTFAGFTKIDLPDKDGKQVEEFKETDNLIVIDSHGKDCTTMDFPTLKRQGYFYYSTACSKDKYDIPLGEFKDLKWEQVEAIFTKVAILDERIQNKTDEEQQYIQNLSRRDLLELRGIFVPKLSGEDQQQAFNLRSFVFGNDVKRDNVTSLETIIKDFMSKNHYVVLHFSILEKMAGVKEQELDTYYRKLATTKDPSHYLVLTSGKGTPSTLPEGAYFINFASLDRAVKNLSKVELVQHLNALRVHHKSK